MRAGQYKGRGLWPRPGFLLLARGGIAAVSARTARAG